MSVHVCEREREREMGGGGEIIRVCVCVCVCVCCECVYASMYLARGIFVLHRGHDCYFISKPNIILTKAA